MMAMSIQLDAPVQVKTSDKAFSTHGREENIQDESKFQKQLEQARKEQDVQDKKPIKTDSSENQLEKVESFETGEKINSESDVTNLQVSNAEDLSVFEYLVDSKSSTKNLKTDINIEKTIDDSNSLLDELQNTEYAELENSLIVENDDNSVKNIPFFEILPANIDKDVTESVLPKKIVDDSDEFDDDQILLSAIQSQKRLNQENELDPDVKEFGFITNTDNKKTSDVSTKPVITVIDERTSVGDKKQIIKNNSVETSSSADVSINLSAQSSESVFFGEEQVEAKNDFSKMLTDQIQKNANEFVKTGSIVLQNNNSGSINLILHPEELGNVKISLKLSDKVIAAHITVESEEAYNAFKNSIQALKSAFESGGFESGSFDLSWSGQKDQQHQNDANVYGALYEGALPVAFNNDEYAADFVQDFSSSAYQLQNVNVIA